MKIIHVRVSVLESGPGYNNSSCTLEAQLEDGENYADVASELRAMCKSQIKGAKELDRLWEDINGKREELLYLQKKTAEQRAEIDKNRATIRSHERLADLAMRENIDCGDFIDNALPF